MTQPAEQPKRGRPEGAKTKISKLQRIANRLEQMARTQAMTIIQESLDGKSVDKEKLSTAKWTVTTAKEFHKAVLSEKEATAETEDEEVKAQIEHDNENKVVFTLVRSEAEKE